MLQVERHGTSKADRSKEVAAAEKVRADEDTSKAEGAAVAARHEDGGRPGGRVATYLKNADANQDGFLTKDEFPALLDNPEVEHLLARSKNENLKTDDAGDLFALADRDSDGRVSLQELIADAKKIGMDNAEQALLEEDGGRPGGRVAAYLKK